MGQRKSYGQFCALARALDRVGDRWTLLVIRELLLGPRTFRQLHSALDGISPTLLIARLGALVDDGLVQRNDAPARSKSVSYRRTEAGAELEPAILELIRWGARWMISGPRGDRVEPAWAALALRALLDGTPSGTRARRVVHLDVGGVWLTVRVEDQRTVIAGRHGRADATIAAAMPELLALASGYRGPADLSLRVDGDASLVEVALVPRGAHNVTDGPAWSCPS